MCSSRIISYSVLLLAIGLAPVNLGLANAAPIPSSVSVSAPKGLTRYNSNIKRTDPGSSQFDSLTNSVPTDPNSPGGISVDDLKGLLDGLPGNQGEPNDGGAGGITRLVEGVPSDQGEPTNGNIGVEDLKGLLDSLPSNQGEPNDGNIGADDLTTLIEGVPSDEGEPRQKEQSPTTVDPVVDPMGPPPSDPGYTETAPVPSTDGDKYTYDPNPVPATGPENTETAPAPASDEQPNPVPATEPTQVESPPPASDGGEWTDPTVNSAGSLTDGLTAVPSTTGVPSGVIDAVSSPPIHGAGELNGGVSNGAPIDAAGLVGAVTSAGSLAAGLTGAPAKRDASYGGSDGGYTN